MNQPRFCYVLTTTGRDTFADMTYASAMFLRQVHPEAEVICLCDAPSHRALEASQHSLLEVVDRTQSVETLDGSPGYRNRFVKTQMRQVVEGDFVYLDADTLVVRHVDEMLACTAPMGAIANHSSAGDPAEIPSDERSIIEMMGWPLPRQSYINGGVLLLRDCETTRRFGGLWHNKWLELTRHGQYRDQPSLNSALTDSGIDFDLLDSRFNGQINERPNLAATPVAIWHFYYSQSGCPDYQVPKTMLDEAIARFHDTGRLTVDDVREISQWPYPWRTPTVLDRWFVRRRVLHRDDLPPYSTARYWLAGHRWMALKTHLQWHLSHQR